MMNNEEINKNDVEINLSQINWNCLSVKEFNNLEKKFQEDKKISKISKDKTKRKSGTINIKLHGKIYEIKEIVFQRLKTMKNSKSKEKLITEIISSHNPIANL